MTPQKPPEHITTSYHRCGHCNRHIGRGSKCVALGEDSVLCPRCAPWVQWNAETQQWEPGPTEEDQRWALDMEKARKRHAEFLRIQVEQREAEERRKDKLCETVESIHQLLVAQTLTSQAVDIGIHLADPGQVDAVMDELTQRLHVGELVKRNGGGTITFRRRSGPPVTLSYAPGFPYPAEPEEPAECQKPPD